MNSVAGQFSIKYRTDTFFCTKKLSKEDSGMNKCWGTQFLLTSCLKTRKEKVGSHASRGMAQTVVHFSMSKTQAAHGSATLTETQRIDTVWSDEMLLRSSSVHNCETNT